MPTNTSEQIFSMFPWTCLLALCLFICFSIFLKIPVFFLSKNCNWRETQNENKQIRTQNNRVLQFNLGETVNASFAYWFFMLLNNIIVVLVKCNCPNDAFMALLPFFEIIIRMWFKRDIYILCLSRGSLNIFLLIV